MPPKVILRHLGRPSSSTDGMIEGHGWIRKMVVVIVMRVIPEGREGHGEFPFITTVLRKATVAGGGRGRVIDSSSSRSGEQFTPNLTLFSR